AMPVIGFLNASSRQGYPRQLSAFLKGLQEAGYVDGQNVVIQYRWAEGHNDRLPAMAADLVQSQVTVIAATSTPAALAAKAATLTIPIVFETGTDPIQLGLVTNLNRPSGNVTGATSLSTEIMAEKGLELLHELIPSGRVIGLLVNSTNPATAEPPERIVLSTARRLGLEVHVLKTGSERDFEEVFAKLVDMRANGLVISAVYLFRRAATRALPPSVSEEFNSRGRFEPFALTAILTDAHSKLTNQPPKFTKAPRRTTVA